MLYLDLETYSTVPIERGAHAYAEGSEILLAAFAVDDDDVTVLDFTADPDGSRERLEQVITYADQIVIHNSAFDRTVLAKHGIHIPAHRVHDTMVQALAHSLPGKLSDLCAVLEIDEEKSKSKRGAALVHLFTKPLGKNRKLSRATRETHPVEWAEFIEYARYDIISMRECMKAMPDWNLTPQERNLWLLDQCINERGVAVDADLAVAAREAARKTTDRLAAQMCEATGGAIKSSAQRSKLLELLWDLKVDIGDLRSSTVEDVLKHGKLSPLARLLLTNRLEASSTSPAKYAALLGSVSPDGRLRGTLQFCGASRTGRWGGRVFQPQNLPRPTLKNDDIEAGIEAMKLGVEDLLFDNVMELCSSAIRGCLVAPPGRKLVIADLSNIEGRMLAFLSGEQWKLDAFAAYDKGEGHDLYKLAYARSYNVKPEDVTSEQRQIGKVMELACLGPDTRVFTQRGIVAITDVRVTDLLWDGEQWVKHCGVIDRGVKLTGEFLPGLISTPDHALLSRGIDGESWVETAKVASCENTRCQVLETGLESLRYAASSSNLPAAYAPCSSRAVAAPIRTRSRSLTCGAAPPPDARSAAESSKSGRSSSGLGTKLLSLTRSTGADSATAYPLATTGATTLTTGDMRTTGGAGSRFGSLGGKIGRSFWRTLSHWTGGTIRAWNWTASTSTKVTSRATCVSSPRPKTPGTSGQSRTCSGVSLSWKRVYDIANAGPRNRFMVLTDAGPVIAHNCGYQGSRGAFMTMGATLGVDLPERTVDEIVAAWRGAHSRTKNLWYLAEEAARRAIATPGKTFKAGPHLSYRMDGMWLRCELPSKRRFLCYPRAALDPTGSLSYEGQDLAKRWSIIQTYGGKLIENATQAASRDILAAGLVKAAQAGYNPVLHVHDEIICETPDDPSFSAEGLAALMSEGTQWSVGLPLAAAGFETYRYRKG